MRTMRLHREHPRSDRRAGERRAGRDDTARQRVTRTIRIGATAGTQRRRGAVEPHPFGADRDARPIGFMQVTGLPLPTDSRTLYESAKVYSHNDNSGGGQGVMFSDAFAVA